MTQDGVLLHGFGFTNFRSFYGPESELVGPMDKIHLIAGPNNSGKSNVLDVAARILPALAHDRHFRANERDRPTHLQEAQLAVRIPWDPTPDEIDHFARNETSAEVNKLLNVALPSDEHGVRWWEFSPNQAQTTPAWLASAWQVDALVSAAQDRFGPAAQNTLEQLSLQFTSGAYGSPELDAQNLLRVAREMFQVNQRLPPVIRIQAFRKIEATDEIVEGEHGGAGLIRRLMELANPSDFHAEDDIRRFEAINRFVATLLEDPHARLQVPTDLQTIFLRHHGRRLPLENYGTGIHQVVILAAAATVYSRHLICVEEPEIHLHPMMQRRLLTYLREETDNQYLIATHSPHLLDAAKASISAVSLTTRGSVLRPAIEPREVSRLSSELGLRASDLVQANAIVWVEGPSDRTYLRHWLSLVDGDLVEGVHFSIMFYGGALLSELASEDPSVEDFIKLPRINRNFSVLIDSDRTSADAPLNDTKKRVRSEFEKEKVRGVVWVTAGYTIENYVLPDLLAEAVAEVHERATYRWDGARYENPLGSKRFTDRQSPADKAAIAREVVERWTDETGWPYDLRERVEELAAKLREVNDLPPREASA